MGIFSRKDNVQRVDDSVNLMSSEEKYRKIFELSPDAIILLDGQGRLIDVNGRLLDWLGYSPTEMIGKNLVELPFLSAKSKAIVVSKFAKRMLGKAIVPYKIEFTSKSGKGKIGLIRATAIKDDKGKMVEDLVIITDVTKEDEVDRALKESERRYAIVTKQTGQLIYDYNIKTGEIVWSGAIKEVTGYEDGEFNIGIKEWEDHIHPDDHKSAASLLQESIKTGEKYVAEYRFRTKAGDYKHIRDSGAFFKDKKGVSYRMLGVMADISDVKNRELELRTRTREAERLNELVIGRELKMAEMKKTIKGFNKKK